MIFSATIFFISYTLSWTLMNRLKQFCEILRFCEQAKTVLQHFTVLRRYSLAKARNLRILRIVNGQIKKDSKITCPFTAQYLLSDGVMGTQPVKLLGSANHFYPSDH